MAKQQEVEKQRRTQEVLAKALEVRPGLPHAWKYAAGIDPDYVDVFNELFKHVLHREGVLPRKTKEMIIAMLLASRLSERASLHLEHALATGATEAELLEALEVTQILTGAPTFIFGAEALSKVVAKRKESSE